MLEQSVVGPLSRRRLRVCGYAWYRTALLAAVLTLLGLSTATARAADVTLEHVASRSGRSVAYPTDQTSGEVVALTLSAQQAPRLLRVLGDRIHVELAAGGYFDADPEGGPVGLIQSGVSWHHRLPDLARTAFVEFGTGVTLHEEERIEDRPMGGRFFFTSQVTLGRWLSSTRDARVGLRVQHTSNAGITEPNPGLDVVMLELAFPL